MADVKDLRNFFKSAENKSDAKIPPFLASALGSVSQSEISMINHEMKLCVQPQRYYKIMVQECMKLCVQPQRYYKIMVQECIKTEVSDYALMYETKADIDKFGK